MLTTAQNSEHTQAHPHAPTMYANLIFVRAEGDAMRCVLVRHRALAWMLTLATFGPGGNSEEGWVGE